MFEKKRMFGVRLFTVSKNLAENILLKSHENIRNVKQNITAR